MYIIRTTFLPHLGRATELEAHLKAGATREKADGYRVSLLRRVFGPRGPEYLLRFFVDTLAEWEARQAKMATYQPFQQQVATTQTLIREAIATECHEVLIPMPSPEGPPPRYVQETRFLPKPGCAPALRESLTNRVRSNQAVGVRQALGAQVIPHEGAAFHMFHQLADLAAVGALRQSLLASEEFRQHAAKQSEFFAANPHISLWEVVEP